MTLVILLSFCGKTAFAQEKEALKFCEDFLSHLKAKDNRWIINQVADSTDISLLFESVFAQLEAEERKESRLYYNGEYYKEVADELQRGYGGVLPKLYYYIHDWNEILFDEKTTVKEMEGVDGLKTENLFEAEIRFHNKKYNYLIKLRPIYKSPDKNRFVILAKSPDYSRKAIHPFSMDDFDESPPKEIDQSSLSADSPYKEGRIPPPPPPPVETYEDINEESRLMVAPPPRPDPPKIFMMVEQAAEFPGGDEKLHEFIKDNMRYPRKAKRKEIEGTVLISFDVEKDGEITNVQIEKDIGAGCGEEAIRIVKEMPKWNPFKINGEAVKEKMRLPIIFKLSN